MIFFSGVQSNADNKIKSIGKKNVDANGDNILCKIFKGNITL